MKNGFEVAVIGDSPAGGCKAMVNISKQILLIAMNKGMISYNPAIESINKGGIVHGINAFGEYSRTVSGKSMFQFNILNGFKGTAIRSSCSQNDCSRFSEKWQLVIENSKRLDFGHVPRETLRI